MASELDLFKAIPEGDQGGQLLAGVFGPGWDDLAGQGYAGGAAGLAHALISSFNWVALAGVCLLFALVMVQGVAATACEGVPLGRRWSSLWMPLRFSAAMGLLAPIMKGLSVFQVLMLMAVGASVNLANHVWGVGLEKLFGDGSARAMSAPDALLDDSRDLSVGILKALTIQEYFRQRMDLGLSGPLAPETWWPPVTKEAGGLLILTMAVPKGSNLSPGDLGRLRLPCEDPAGDMCRARLAAVRNLIDRLSPLAEALADPKRVLTLYESGLLARSVQAYRLDVQPWLEVIRDSEADNVVSSLNEFKEAAAANGWVAAGACYWNIARLNESMGGLLYSTATWTEGDPRLAGEVLEDFGAVWDRLDRYQNGAFRPERAVSAESVPAEFPSASWFGDKISGYVGREALSSIIDSLKNGDPIMVLAGLGRFLISTAEAVIGLKVASTAIVAATGSSASSLLGQVVSVFSGTLSSFMAGAAAGAVEAIGPYMVILSLLLISYGFFLAYSLFNLSLRRLGLGNHGGGGSRRGSVVGGRPRPSRRGRFCRQRGPARLSPLSGGFGQASHDGFGISPGHGPHDRLGKADRPYPRRLRL